MTEEKKHEKKKGLKKTQEGVVVSAKMQKSVVVAVTRQVRHGQYGKFVQKTSKYMVHDEDSKCSIGDTVRIIEARPISKNKKWALQEVLTKASV